MAGSIEAVHVAGTHMVVVHGPPKAPGTALGTSYAGEGCLVLLDFCEGLAAMQASRAAAARAAQQGPPADSNLRAGSSTMLAGSTTSAAAASSYGSIAHVRQLQPAKKRRGPG
jgi:hypothetical protein